MCTPVIHIAAHAPTAHARTLATQQHHVILSDEASRVFLGCRRSIPLPKLRHSGLARQATGCDAEPRHPPPQPLTELYFTTMWYQNHTDRQLTSLSSLK